MKTGESLLSIGKFIAEYSAHLMGAGVHTSRVVRNTKRIGEAFGLDVKLSVFHRNIILTIIDKETNEACNEVIDIPAHPISFEHNSELSALSWEAVDNHLSLEELKANMEKSKKELEHAIHNKNILEQRKRIVERKERSHRLIVKGAEFEKAFPLSRDLEQEEVQDVMDQLQNSSYNKSIVRQVYIAALHKEQQQIAEAVERAEKGDDS